jgi:hypothetical protein
MDTDATAMYGPILEPAVNDESYVDPTIAR